MKQYIIFIGGTGSRCAESFLYLSATGALGLQETEILLLDADLANGDFIAACDLLERYKTLNNALHIAGESATGHTLCFGKDVTGEKCVIGGNSFESAHADFHLADLADFTFGMAKSGHYEARQLMKALYTRAEMENEITSIGYFSHPNVGAAAIRATIIRDDDVQNPNNKTPYGNFCRMIINSLATDEVRVLLVGSVFGGSGASALPALAEDVKKQVNVSGGKAYASRLFVGAVMMLPYFTIKKDVNPADGVNANEFPLAAKDALRYYSNDNDNPFNRCYLLGCGVLESYENLGSGGAKQTNRPHVVEWEAALAAADFFSAPSIEQDTKEHLFKRVRYLSKQSGAFLYLKEWNDFSASLKQYVINFTMMALIMTRYYIPEMCAMNKRRIKENWYINYVGYDNWYDKPEGQTTIKALSDFLNGYLEWFAVSLTHRKIQAQCDHETEAILNPSFLAALAGGEEPRILKMMKKPSDLFDDVPTLKINKVQTEVRKGLGEPLEFRTLLHGVYKNSRVITNAISAKASVRGSAIPV
jgi:hypothetical protein